jgi:FkbM family methyltransferase
LVKAVFGKRRLRLKCSYTLGDIVVLSAALRDLHLAYPGEFVTDVDTTFPEVWENNPFVTRLGFDAHEINCNEVELDRDGSLGIHYTEAYLRLLNKKLGTGAKLTATKGDIYISAREKSWYSDIWSLCGREIPFWIVGAGGKFDIPIKWWDSGRYQAMVRHFAGEVQFVQTGWWGDQHPRLEGAIDLRGKTSVRDLILLVYHAQGVLCGVTSLMHLAAAVPTIGKGHRGAVIIAGAREPRSWEAYPGHFYLSTHDLVRCGNCWRNRVQPLPDGANRKKYACTNPVGDLPLCMDFIPADQAILAVKRAIQKFNLPLLSKSAARLARKAVAVAEEENSYELHNVTLFNAVEKAATFLASIRPYPKDRFERTGIVICGGGVTYFANAWVCVNILRRHGCRLPIELWHLGRHEIDQKMEGLIARLGVRCVNAREVMNRFPMRNPLGWELKSYALLHSSFKEVLLLDSDNVATRDPTFLFDTAEYKEYGAIFWPDYGRLAKRKAIWKLSGIQYRNEPEFESGQMVVNKEKCWKAANLAFWYNDHSEFFYKFIHGDKETFHLAWRKLDLPYAMPRFPIKELPGTMCQHDFAGKILFQHRNLNKWKFFEENEFVPGFKLEEECLAYITSLKNLWDGRIKGRREYDSNFGITFRRNTADRNIFQCVAIYNEYQLGGDFARHDIVVDIGAHIGSFSYLCHLRGAGEIHAFEPHPENYQLARSNLRNFQTVKVYNRAVLDRTGSARLGDFSATSLEQNTGGCSLSPEGPSLVQAIGIDEAMRALPRVRLVKMDCEGSEWPILMNSKEIWRAESLCGEYHECKDHPVFNANGQTFDRKILKTVLKEHYHYVKTLPDRTNSVLGRFWAWAPRQNGHARFQQHKIGRNSGNAVRSPFTFSRP